MTILFDLLLCGAMIALTLGLVTSADTFSTVVMFIGLGMLMALTWARLGSVDLALAEAAVGAGFTGVLLLTACRTVPDPAKGTRPRQPVLFGLCLVAGAALAWMLLLELPAPQVTAVAVHAAFDAHVLDNSVTAVLLDYRGYDTLLEMVVLLLALVGLRLLLAQKQLPDLHPVRPVQGPLIAPLLAVQIPFLSLMALYLFHAGSDRPGGAFQAGALLAALGILLRLTGHLTSAPRLQPGLEFLAIAGLAAFSLAASVSLYAGQAPLSWPTGAAYLLMLVTEFAVMLSTAVTLVLLFGSTPGLARAKPR